MTIKTTAKNRRKFSLFLLTVCFERDNYKILIGVFCSRKVKSYWLHAYDVGWGGVGGSLLWLSNYIGYNRIFIITVFL